MKLATKPIQPCPPNLRHVDALPWEIKIQIFSRYSADMEENANKLFIYKDPTSRKGEEREGKWLYSAPPISLKSSPPIDIILEYFQCFTSCVATVLLISDIRALWRSVTSSSAMAERPRELGDFKKAR